MISKYVLGIDLGTTNSCVAVIKNGNPEVISNDRGSRTTPSCVAFTATERLIGQAALDQAIRNPRNTIYDNKRLIGRRAKDPGLQQELANLPFKLTSNEQEQLIINVDYKKTQYSFFPEEISAMILSKMKMVADEYLGANVIDAVITVPAYFNDSQRQATEDAAKIAGLNCLRIINEPTAAGLAYGLDKHCSDEQRVLIFDLGGGTFDVTIMAIENNVFQVEATDGDTRLGGRDFNERMVEYLGREFALQNNGTDLQHDAKAMGKLRVACEKAKIALSAASQTAIDIDALYQGIDFSYTMTRATFESICMDLFKRCFAIVDRILETNNIKKDSIHEIIPVGGSTRIPLVQKMLRECFNGRDLNRSIHPDEAVAIGAAIHGSLISTNTSGNKPKDSLLIDVTPLSLGVETAGGVMSRIIERNTTIPCKRQEPFTTYTDNQKAVNINIYEGERELTGDNYFLGSFEVLNLPEAPRGVPQIVVTFAINENGILTASAEDVASGTGNKIQIIKNEGRLTPSEITKLIEDAEAHKKEDLRQRHRIETRNRLEVIIYQIRNNLTDPEIEAKIHEEEKRRLMNATDATKMWLDTNPNADITEIEKHKTDIEQQSNTIFTRIYSGIPKPM